MNETPSERAMKYMSENISRHLDPDHENIARVILRDYFEYGDPRIWDLYMDTLKYPIIDLDYTFDMKYELRRLSPKSRNDILFIAKGADLTWCFKCILK
jgi:hypothetical protein